MSVQNENEYEDLLSQWSDLESGLGIILSSPASTQEFTHRVRQYDRWMQGLMQRDPDVGLYLLFQLAGNSPVGYSASHSLVCAVLCHLIATELLIAPKERDSLVQAALTMNIAMTALQDELATQVEKPTPQQQDAIRVHSVKGAMMLANLGVADDNWLEIVTSHHDDAVEKVEWRTAPTLTRLTRILKVVDRYAAMISPRMSRAGRSATESARAVMANVSVKSDEIGHAMVRSVGLCPPGTYVRLDNDELAIVVRRSSKHNQPYVAIVGKSNGEMFPVPRLHATAQSYPRIRAALASSSVRARLNHFHVLQLGAYAATQP
ncbi:HD-GYP domain-containing protein [Rhodoferax saidenbachensis]|uniref:Phosphodiesterase n=1 Tax=Rhodoferax saidenbachensis TaxID=1484693 RepID=A0A1P8K7I3_9BURK|nr:HD domain-containing protein [Rhodoferax saidenbachensis]APW41987.1 phosphodiesterase [Rhodoferax saidenbachensis]